MVLEKALLSAGIWSPLRGYRGVCKFENDQDEETLIRKGKYSKLKIHKMHGSINCGIPGILEHQRKDHDIVIVMDDIENNKFHFDGLLDRNPERPPYVGRHEPECTFPSFIKPFERKEMYEIWQSAIKAMSGTKEIVIIGYSFRPEDSNAYLLLSVLLPESKIILVDCNQEEIKKRLESKGF